MDYSWVERENAGIVLRWLDGIDKIIGIYETKEIKELARHLWMEIHDENLPMIPSRPYTTMMHDLGLIWMVERITSDEQYVIKRYLHNMRAAMTQVLDER